MNPQSPDPNDSARTPEKQQAETLAAIRGKHFAEDRAELARLDAEIAAAEKRREQVESPDFKDVRRAMLRDLAENVFLYLVVFMAAFLEYVILQEFSRELAANIRKGLMGDSAWLTLRLINQAMALVLNGCFIAALLTTKKLTNFQPDVEKWRSCPLPLRWRPALVIASKIVLKLVYLAAIAAMFYYIHVRQETAFGQLQSDIRAGEVMADFGNTIREAARSPADKPEETIFAGYWTLYLLDIMLHGLVLFGLQSVTTKTIELSRIFASPTRLRRRITRLHTQHVQRANNIVSLLDASDVPAAEREGYRRLLTEDERQLINKLYGRIEIAEKGTPPAPIQPPPPVEPATPATPVAPAEPALSVEPPPQAPTADAKPDAAPTEPQPDTANRSTLNENSPLPQSPPVESAHARPVENPPQPAELGSNGADHPESQALEVKPASKPDTSATAVSSENFRAGQQGEPGTERRR